MLTLLLALALLALVAESAQAATPTADELDGSVAARYRALRTYHDRGTVLGEGLPLRGYAGEFETFFVRGEGFKLVWTNRWRGAESDHSSSGIVWGSEQCLTSYFRGTPPEPCGPPVERLPHGPVNASTPGMQALLVPSHLLTGLQWRPPFRTVAPRNNVSVRSRRVAEERGPDGRRLYAVTDEGVGDHARYTQRLWLDAVSRHIVRHRLTTTGASGPAYTETIEYSLVELDAPLDAAVVKEGPPFLEVHAFSLGVVALSIIGLVIPAVIAHWFGRNYGRRRTATLSGTMLRALAWTVLLSWSVVPVEDHETAILPMPSVLAIAIDGLDGALLGAPPPALSLLIILVAALYGVRRGRRSRARDQAAAMEAMEV